MKTDNETSGSTSGTTYASAPGSPQRSTPPADSTRQKPESTESQFITEQAEIAKAAIARTFADLKNHLGRGIDPRLWAKQYPWITVGSAAVAGFVATTLLVPSKEQQALNKLAAIERALTPAPPPNAPPQPVASDGDNARQFKAGKNSLMTMIAREVIGAIKPAIISLITAGMTAKEARPSEAEMQAAAAKEDPSQGGAATVNPPS